jgi:hypothetical protein
MRFALIDNEKVEARPGLKGAICPLCSQPVIAKCGTQKVNHWAHRTIKTCDNWWEPETEWHRSWKNNFPVDWQEVIMPNERTGEKHIADVRTKHGLVIEFQHSHIDPQERISREQFYKNMVWIVDGTRLKRDYPRLVNNINKWGGFHKENELRLYTTFDVDWYFPKNWVECSVPVIFDFRGSIQASDPEDAMRDILWCLLPGRAEHHALLVKFDRDSFLAIAREHPSLFQQPAHEIVRAYANRIRQKREREARQAMHYTYPKRIYVRRGFRRRRF